MLVLNIPTFLIVVCIIFLAGFGIGFYKRLKKKDKNKDNKSK